MAAGEGKCQAMLDSDDGDEEDRVEVAVFDALTVKTAQPTPEHVRSLVRLIKSLMADPVTDKTMSDMRNQTKELVIRKQAYDRAAIALRQELEEITNLHGNEPDDTSIFTQNARQRIDQIESALSALECPVHYYFYEIEIRSSQIRGPTTSPWVCMAEAIARSAWKALRDAGRKENSVGAVDGPIVNCVGGALELILQGNNVPGRSTIHDAIKGLRFSAE